MAGAGARAGTSAVVQFVKGGKWKTGERKLADHLGIEWHTLGDGFTWESTDLDETAAKGRHAWEVAAEKLASGDYDLLILDELTYAMKYGWVAGGRRGRRPAEPVAASTNVVLTGRDAPPRADRDRRHRHRDAQGQARVRRRASGPEGHRVLTRARHVPAGPLPARRLAWPPVPILSADRVGGRAATGSLTDRSPGSRIDRSHQPSQAVAQSTSVGVRSPVTVAGPCRTVPPTSRTCDGVRLPARSNGPGGCRSTGESATSGCPRRSWSPARTRGRGKTTVATGLLAALRAGRAPAGRGQGRAPTSSTPATTRWPPAGRGRNLDAWMCGADADRRRWPAGPAAAPTCWSSKA